jgi:hypothetical protein
MSRVSLVAAIVCAAGLCAASEALAAPPAVAVRLYDVTGAGPAARGTAMRIASEIARQAGVTLHWKDCSRGGADFPCTAFRGPRELVVRLTPEPRGQDLRAADALSVHGADGTSDLRVGFAAVDPATRAGVLATIYYDRVEQVAAHSGIPGGRFLGRAIAHELGHLLLPSRPHSRSGLMRAVWTVTAAADDHPSDWLFSADDSRRLRAAAAAH